jgi:hypothetical protein
MQMASATYDLTVLLIGSVKLRGAMICSLRRGTSVGARKPAEFAFENDLKVVSRVLTRPARRRLSAGKQRRPVHPMCLGQIGRLLQDLIEVLTDLHAKRVNRYSTRPSKL